MSAYLDVKSLADYAGFVGVSAGGADRDGRTMKQHLLPFVLVEMSASPINTKESTVPLADYGKLAIEMLACALTMLGALTDARRHFTARPLILFRFLKSGPQIRLCTLSVLCCPRWVGVIRIKASRPSSCPYIL